MEESGMARNEEMRCERWGSGKEGAARMNARRHDQGSRGHVPASSSSPLHDAPRVSSKCLSLALLESSFKDPSPPPPPGSYKQFPPSVAPTTLTNKRINRMGLSNFPTAAEGLLPVLVMNTVVSVALLKNMFRSLLQVLAWNPLDMNVLEQEDDGDDHKSISRRRVSITQYKCVSDGGARWRTAECCVCLCGFQGSEEVSELSCKHFFHTACLDKWFLNRHTTCPLCRSTS